MAITFDANGKWETTFDCAEQSWNVGGRPSNCDGLGAGGSGTVGFVDSQITSAANNPEGSGGRGARFFIGDFAPGTTTSTNNVNSQPIGVHYPSPQPEVWIRFYTRYQQGFEWVRKYPLNVMYDKQLYLWNYEKLNWGVLEYNYSAIRLTAPYGTGSMYTPHDIDWHFVNGSPVGHGNWNCHEIYMKMDTDGTDGIARYWINGVLWINNTAVDWAGGSSARRAGWGGFHFTSNQAHTDNLNGPIGNSIAYVDYDDMVIYNQTPPNVDEHGNPFIGPLDTVPPSYLHPLGLSSTNITPFNYFSVQDIGTPVTRQVQLDQSGSPATLDSETLTVYLVSENAVSGAKVSASNADAGVEWLFSSDNVNWDTELVFGALGAGSATAVYIKVRVANDGSVSGNQQSAKIQISKKI